MIEIRLSQVFKVLKWGACAFVSAICLQAGAQQDRKSVV